jgi:hypothetical protein
MIVTEIQWDKLREIANKAASCKHEIRKYKLVIKDLQDIAFKELQLERTKFNSLVSASANGDLSWLM